MTNHETTDHSTSASEENASTPNAPAEMTVEQFYKGLIGYNMTYANLKKALDSNDSWGGMVHAFEYVGILGYVEQQWPKELR